ncbi:MAG: hypothetical protein N3A55_11075, partial [Methylohalobius sp.]|nr:hypothetical protein [Methylohalobius sp.]
MNSVKIALVPQEKLAAVQSPTRTGRRLDLDRCALWLGLVLVVAFLLQDFGSFHWPWLEQLQTDGTYRQLSGLALVAFLAHQWHLAALRSCGLMRKAGALMRSHKL